MKDSFILYTKYKKQIAGLNMEQRGVLLTAILCHESGERDLPEMDAATNMAYGFICVDLDENAKKYADKCAVNSANGAKGGRPKKQTDSEKTERFYKKRTQPKKADNEYDNDNDMKENKKDILSEPPVMVAVRDVVDHLNKTAGTHYFASSRVTVEKIQARLRDGFSVDDCKKVIDIKTAEWKGTDMAKYLRPETLFGSKFESYLNQPPEKRGGTKFQNFPSRQDQDHNDMVSKIIAMQTGG